jgi:HTH-type transcriptional repressor of NAD biosynthesis genes
MTTAWVLLTAMPPTVGHLALVDFARHCADRVRVVLCTQPDEPFVVERAHAVRVALSEWPTVSMHHLHATLPQNPSEAADFWPMWRDILTSLGLAADDIIVASESYGHRLAEVTGTTYLPFDPDRVVVSSRATSVRMDPIAFFDTVLPDFQPILRTTITVFGSESTGKTTLSRALAERLGGYWLPEWARPYLEQLPDPTVTDERMHAVWRGQRALQRVGGDLRGRPFVIQDTDLVSTVGYWQHWNPTQMPEALVDDARALRSDLYLVLSSTIPFERDPLRYGGDQRETDDAYWVTLLENLGLTYGVIANGDREVRLEHAEHAARAAFAAKADLTYTRR